MASFVRDISVTCPPQRVFAVLSDLDRLPEFSDMTVAVRNGPGRLIATGDRFEQAVKVLGIEFDTDWEVTSVVADTLIELKGKSLSNGTARLVQQIVPEGDGCRVTFTVDYDPPFGLLGEIADKVLFERQNEQQAERILLALKGICEAVPVPT